MDDFVMRYREVIPDQTNPALWRDITLTTGETISTLQDIKVPEKAGGYSYKDVSKIHNRNRFIYWRSSHDVLEVAEISFDINLMENCVRIKFTDSPILNVSIYENHGNVVMLIATVSSLHRFTLPHPDTLINTSDQNEKSILANVSADSFRDPKTYYVIGSTSAASSNTPTAHTAASWLQPNGKEALFAVAFQNSLMLFTMNCETGQTNSVELRQSQIITRIFSNITEALKGNRGADHQFAVSIAFNAVRNSVFLFALYRDDQIRMWSTKTGHCVASVSCLQHGMEAQQQGPQKNCIKAATPTKLCVFLSYANGSEFLMIEAKWDGSSNYSLVRSKYLAAPQFDLVDYELSDSKIWALWCNAQGEFNVSNYSISATGHEINWDSVALEPPPDNYSVDIEQGMDPGQEYCGYIFTSRKFQRHVIAKALLMFKRASVVADMNLPMNVLKDRVIDTVEHEIQNEIKDFDVTDEEYIETCTRHWERFFSCCEQYHNKAAQPLGLILMDFMGAVCLIKKTSISILRPCDPLEHMLAARDDAKVSDFNNTQFVSDPSICADLIKLVTVLSVIDDQLPLEYKNDINKKLFQLNQPNEIISKLVSEILGDDFSNAIFPRSFIQDLRQDLEAINDISAAIVLLLDALRMEFDEMEGMTLSHKSLAQSSRIYLNMGYLFCSSFGISVTAESVRQMAHVRFLYCRNLLILQNIIQNIFIDTYSINNDVMEVIRSKCMPETIVFLQAYYVLVWLCETPTIATQQTTAELENNIQRLSVVNISNARNYIPRPTQNCSLLEYFLRSKGMLAALAVLARSPYKDNTDPQWHVTLLPLVSIVGQLLWAVSGNFLFGEWLVGSCQHILIQQYVRLLNGWCEWNSCSRQFILAVSLLTNGEYHKAADMFIKASRGILNEQFLAEKILQTNEEISSDEAIIQYYLKIIRLFEQHGALDYVITFAEAAIGVPGKNDSQMAMFQSIVFANHLLLEHFDEAYHSLVSNVESSRRKDCLRHLVVCLFQQKRLDLLMQFPYKDLQEELENIVESRARSMPIEENDHYDFLYSFYVAGGNMRKASAIMYEQAIRFQLELVTTDGLVSRHECLLACINTLQLIDKDYAWIAKPVQISGDDMETDSAGNDKIEVLDIKDIRKELLLTEAKISLLKFKKDLNIVLNTGIAEVLALLSNTGLYNSAIRLASEHNLQMTSIFESLTSACIRSMNDHPNETWNWLQENDLADLPYKNSATDMAWALLQSLLEENEENNSIVLHQAITNKILSAGQFVPLWLYTSFRKRNPSVLLRLYVHSGRLIEATDLAKEYIMAMVSSGTEYFGLSNNLNVKAPALCFPVNTIDQLMYGLKLSAESNKGDVEYRQCYAELSDIVNFYLDTAERISNDKIRFEMESVRDKQQFIS